MEIEKGESFMSDVDQQAKALAASMFAMARESGALKDAAITATPELMQHAESSLAKAIESMIRLSEGEGLAAAEERDDVITARAFWWGWHLRVPHSQVEPLINGVDDVSAIIDVALHLVPEVGEIVALVLKLYVTVMAGVIKAVDKGKGVYLSQTWLIEGAIIASGGVLAGPALAAAFIPTTIE